MIFLILNRTFLGNKKKKSKFLILKKKKSNSNYQMKVKDELSV